MTRTNKFWAIGVLGLSLYSGVSVMFGHIPGANSGIGTFEDIAALTEYQVERHGPVFTGLFVMVIGLCFAAGCLAGGGGSRDAGSWDIGEGSSCFRDSDGDGDD